MSNNSILQPEVVHLDGLKLHKATTRTLLSANTLSIVMIAIVVYTFNVGLFTNIWILFGLLVFVNSLILGFIYYFNKLCFMDGAMDCLIHRINPNSVSLG